MLIQHDRLLVERNGLVGWLGLRVGPPQGYRTRNGGILMLLESAGPISWDDDDIAADENDEDDEEEDEDDELLPGDDDEDEEDEDDDVEEEE